MKFAKTACLKSPFHTVECAETGVRLLYQKCRWIQYGTSSRDYRVTNLEQCANSAVVRTRWAVICQNDRLWLVWRNIWRHIRRIMQCISSALPIGMSRDWQRKWRRSVPMWITRTCFSCLCIQIVICRMEIWQVLDRVVIVVMVCSLYIVIVYYG